jgi:hypothetical protein
MKKFFTIFLLLALALSVNAQFKEELDNRPSIREGFINPQVSNNIFGFIDPSKFSMNHSVNMSYSTFAGQAVALGVYTNSLRFNIQVDASIVNSPYNTFGEGYTNSINGIYLSRAAVNFKPSEDTKISLEFRQGPTGYYNNFYNPYYLMSPSFDREYDFYRTNRESK